MATDCKWDEMAMTMKGNDCFLCDVIIVKKLNAYEWGSVYRTLQRIKKWVVCSYEVRQYARNKWDSEDLCPDVDKLFKDRKVAYQQLYEYVLKTCKSDRTEFMYTKELIFVNTKQDCRGITQITSK